MKKRFIASILIGLMLMPQVIHSEELTSDTFLLSDESFLEEEQEIVLDEILQSKDGDDSLVINFEDELISETVPSRVSASDAALNKIFQTYVETLNKPNERTGEVYDKFALVYLNNNDTPDLIAHIPQAKHNSTVHSIAVLLDGEGFGRLNVPFDSAFKYYLERSGFIIVECGPDFFGEGLYYDPFRYAFRPAEDQFYLRSYYEDGSYVYDYHDWTTSNTKRISKEEFQSIIGGGAQKDIPFVANTPENRTKYIPYSTPITPTVVLSKTSITGIYNSTKGADIRWKAVEGATGYEVYRKRGGEGTTKVATITNANTTQCYDSGIKDNCWGCVYNYYVVPVAGSTKGPKSDDVVLQRLAPMTLTSVKNTAAGKAAVTWKCSVNSNKANGYELQYAQSKADLSGRKGTYKAVTINGRNNLSKTISGLTKGKTYYFRIRCYVNYTNSKTGKTTKTWSQYSNVKNIKITK